MYLSICKKDFNDFKVGELFDTYQKINYAYISPRGTESKFIDVPFHEYKSHFTEFKDHTFLPIQETVFRGVFKKREVTQISSLFINLEELDFEDLLSMQLPIINKIDELSKIELFANHTEDLHINFLELKSYIPFNEKEIIKQKINQIASLVNKAEYGLKMNRISN